MTYFTSLYFTHKPCHACMHTTGRTETQHAEHPEDMLQGPQSNCVPFPSSNWAPLTEASPQTLTKFTTTLQPSPSSPHHLLNIHTVTNARLPHHKFHNRNNHFNLITTIASTAPNVLTTSYHKHHSVSRTSQQPPQLPPAPWMLTIVI